MNASSRKTTQSVSRQALSNAEYHAHPAVGSTSLKRVLRSPAHYVYEIENPSEPTPAMQFGSIVHEALLEPNKFLESTIVCPTFSGTGSRAQKEEWHLLNAGKVIVTQDQMTQVKAMIASIDRHVTAKALLKNGEAEVSFFSHDAETGIDVKVRPDYLRENRVIVDVKTCIDASPQAFAKAVANFRYDLSAALYLDTVSAATGHVHDRFVLIAIEKDPPYAIGVYLLDDLAIENGRELYREALNRLSECRTTGRYPGYPDSIASLSLPTWAFFRGDK